MHGHNISQQVTSQEGLEQIRSRFQAQEKDVKYRLLVCAGAGCVSSGCHAVRDALTQALDEAGIHDQVLIYETGCIGTCDLGPTLVVQPDDVFYTKLKPEDMPRIVNQHLVNGRIVEPLCYYDREKEERVRHLSDIEYFKRQVRAGHRALRQHALCLHRGLHRRRRLSGAGEGASRDDPRRGHR